jgi:hypothetical protein
METIMQINGVSNINQVTNQSSKVTSKAKTVGTSFDSILKKETTSLEDIFEKAADKYNVDIDLLKAIAKQESNFNPKAESHSGAQGVMQLMPATAKSLGVTDSFDAEHNIMGGAKYISGLLDKYNGDTKLALAAYNAGSGNVAKYGGIPPFKETQNYVVKVMKYYGQDLDVSGVQATTSKDSSVQTTQNTSTQSDTLPVVSPIITNSQEAEVIDSSDLLDTIYSYDDYQKFIDILYGTSDEDKKDEENNQVYQQLSLSPALAKMLKGI